MKSQLFQVFLLLSQIPVLLAKGRVTSMSFCTCSDLKAPPGPSRAHLPQGRTSSSDPSSISPRALELPPPAQAYSIPYSPCSVEYPRENGFSLLRGCSKAGLLIIVGTHTPCMSHIEPFIAVFRSEPGSCVSPSEFHWDLNRSHFIPMNGLKPELSLPWHCPEAFWMLSMFQEHVTSWQRCPVGV